MDAGERCRREGAGAVGRHGAAGDESAGGGAQEGTGEGDREDAVRVRWRGPEGRAAVTAEMQLLAALEVAGISAAPDVLGIEEDGYVRETAPPLARRVGRRAGGTGSPATGERRALARAREDLEALVAALHERGWVLGAPRGRGLGIRADGRVIVLDLSGLRREEALSARGADRHWIDTVLGDQERTLRRRVHTAPAAADGSGLGTVDVPESLIREVPAAPAPVRPPVQMSPGGPLLAGAPMAGPPPAGPSPAEPLRIESDGERAPLPVPRLRRAHAEGRSAVAEQSTVSAGQDLPRPRGAVDTVLSVLAERRNRRTALLSAGAVLVLGLGTGFALTLPGAPLGDGTRSAATGSAAEGAGAGGGTGGADGEVAGEAPVIEDPWALAAELAGSRHAYLTGASDVPVAAAGGAAEQEDERIRAAYEGLEVRGGGPVVHEAELVQGPDEQGRAVLRVVTSSEDAEVLGGSGLVQQTGAAAGVSVDLSLRWDGQRWRIQEVTAL